MAFELPNLPYERTQLEPHISKETLDYHYGKHHKAYVDKLNAAVKGTDLEHSTLEELIKTASGGVFNNAAQIWNHTFYWNSLSPNGGGKPQGRVSEMINHSFKSFENFKEEFSEKSATLFGSGWVWLCQNKDQLEIRQTKDAENPLQKNLNPLLTFDVWEHAYYIDYKNARPEYIKAFWELVNWDFANSQIK